MFDQTFVNTHAQTRRPWTMAASLAFQTGLVAILLLIPLLHPEVLRFKVEIPVWAPLKPITKMVPVVERRVAPHEISAPRLTVTRVFTAPARVPDKVSMVVDVPQQSDLMMVGPASPVAGPNGIPGLTGMQQAAALPLPAPPVVVRKPEVPKGPTHVSSGVQSAKLLFGPKPLYPALAKAARVQGTVRLQAVISRDGSIQGLTATSGPPLLVETALNAVRQWRYQPTLLNGEPVEVATEIDVNFTLSQ